jgi:hypothetical protein
MTCPNKNTKEYKQLEERVGSVVAHSLFNEFNEDYDAINEYLDSLNPKAVLSKDMKNIFGDSDSTTVKNALEVIAKEDNKVTKLLANKLLRFLSNDTKVVISSLEEMQKIKGNKDNIGGLYDHNTNIVHIRPDMPSRILLHEILHAFTVQQLKGNSQAKKDLDSIYNNLKKEYPELEGEYAMSNLDEFLVGVFTDPKFMTKLQSIPSTTNKNISVWEDLMNVLSEVLTSLGFSKAKSKSILEESMEAAIRVLEDAKSERESVESMYSDEAFDTSQFEDVYASLAPEEKTYYESQTMTKEQEETMKTVLANQNIGLNSDGSFYVRKEGGKDKRGSIEYTRVSDKLENGFKDNGAYELNRQAGNDADTILSDVILGKEFSEVGETPTMDNDVRKEFYDYFVALKNHLTKDGSILMTQQIFSNDLNAVAGATDILVVKPSGKVAIYDLKTSTSSTEKEEVRTNKAGKEYTKGYTKGFEGNKSKKQIHTEQQSMYKRMAELQGLEVENINIVPIQIKFKDGKVVEANNEALIRLDYNKNVAEGLIPDDITQAKSVNDLIAPEKRSVEMIRERLSKLIAHWKNKEKQDIAEALDKLEELYDKMDTVDELVSIQDFIRDAAELAESFKKSMKSIKDNPTSKASIIKLGNINTFMDTFDILEDIQNLMYRESSEAEKKAIDKWNKRRAEAAEQGREQEFLADKDNAFPGIKSTLDETISKMRNIKQDYLFYGRKSMAHLLFSTISDKVLEDTKKLKKKLLKENPNSARAASMITSVQDMERELANSSEDIGMISRWLGSAAGDENAIIALTSLMIKNKLEPVTEQLIHDEHELGEVLETYLKESGKSRNDVGKLYEDILEIVEKKVKNKQGGWDTVKQKQFIDKIDWKKFSKDLSEEYKRLEEAGIDKGTKAHRTAIEKWMNTNTHPKANYKEIVEDRRKNLTPYEFRIWTKNNYPNKAPKGELREPNSNYVSSKWKTLYDDNGNPISAAGRLHKGMLSKYDEIINQLDYKDRIKLTSKGYKLPSVLKGDWERGIKDAKGILKDKVKITARDTNYKNNKVLDAHGKEIKELPKFFTDEANADDVSSDVFESLLKASKNWRYYKAKSEMQAEIQLVRDLVDSQEVNKSDSLGNAINDVKNKFLKGKAKKTGNNLADKLNDHLDVIFYGAEDERADIKLGKQVYSADKGLQGLMFMSSAISLTGNIISGISNATLGNLTNVIEAGAKEYLVPKAIAKAHIRYAASLGNMALDVNRLTGKSLETQLSHLYDFDQAYVEHLGDNASGNRIKQMLDTSSLGFVNNGAEHQIGTTAGFAFLESIKWIDGAFQNRKDYLHGLEGQELKDAKKKFDESTESLLEAYELDSKGVIKLKDKYTLEQKDRSAFKNKLHEINKYNHGNYAKHDKAALQRRWYGKLALFFRKHIQPGLAKRFGAERINYALGSSVEGIYTGTAKACIQFVKEVIDEMKLVGLIEAMSSANKNITPQQKANMRRTVAEGAALLITIAVVSMLGGDDDEPKTWAENLLLLQARRLQSELAFYSSPLEFIRMIKSPTVAMGTVEAATKFGYGLLDGWGGDDVYTRNTGFWDKGDNKDLARLTKLIPGLKSIIALMTPEEQIKTFNKLTL